MDERPSRNAEAGDPESQQRVLFETARALAESATLEDAAPRMLKAVCESLGWQCGAIWQVNRAREHAALRRHVGAAWPAAPGVPGRHRPSIRSSSGSVCPGGSGPAASRSGSGTSRATPTSREHRSPSAPGFIRPSRCPFCQGRRVGGVLEFFSRDMFEPTPELLAMMTTVCSQIGLYVERKWAGEDLDRFFKLSLDLFVRRDVRRLFRAHQPGVADRARILRRGVARIPVHGLRAPGRSGRHLGCDVDADGLANASSTSRTATGRRTAPTSGCSGHRRRSPTRGSSTAWRAT